MGKYTVSVKEIIRLANAGAYPGQPLDLRNDERMIELARGVLFDSTLDMIDPGYQDVFALGFTRHFFNREIGADDLAEFRFWVGEDILNNASFINGIYKALEQGVFSEYRVSENESASTENRTEGVDERVDRNDRTVVDGEVKETGTTTSDADSKSTTEHDTLVTDASDTVSSKTGQDAVKRTGTEGVVGTDGATTTNSGNDTVSHTGDVTSEKDTSDVNQDSGTDSTSYGRKDQRSGSTTTNYGSGLKVAVYGRSDTTGDSTLSFPGGRSSTNSGDRITKYSDTPDDSLANALSGNYLTNATVETDGTSTTQSGAEKTVTSSGQTDTTDTVTTGLVTNGDNTATQASGTDGTTYGKKSTATGSADDKTVYDEKTKTAHGLSTVVDGDSSSTTTHNTTDTTEYGSGEASGTDSTSATTGTDTVTGEDASSTTRDLKTETDQTDTREGSDVRTTDTDGSTETTGRGNEKSLMLQYDMVMRAAPLLDKVWLLFADDFMQVF